MTLKTKKKDLKNLICVIVDHLRTINIALMYGADFGPKNRGYVLRKLIKKVCINSHLFGLNEKDLEEIEKIIINENKKNYPEIYSKKEEIINKIKPELIKHFSYIDKCYKELDKISEKTSPEDFFFFYDTKGIPKEIIEKKVIEKKLMFPKEKFERLIQEQKERSKEERKKKKIKVF